MHSFRPQISIKCLVMLGPALEAADVEINHHIYKISARSENHNLMIET